MISQEHNYGKNIQAMNSKPAPSKHKQEKKKQFVMPDCIFEKVANSLISDPQGSDLLMEGNSCKELLAKIFRYWSLKREDHRGAPLSRRLHLEV